MFSYTIMIMNLFQNDIIKTDKDKFGVKAKMRKTV